jgi:hypothetical protein
MQVESWSASVCVSSGLFYLAPRVFFVGSFCIQTPDELSDELRPPLKCKSPGFNCSATQALDGESGNNAKVRVADHPGVDESEFMSCSRQLRFSFRVGRDPIVRPL